MYEIVRCRHRQRAALLAADESRRALDAIRFGTRGMILRQQIGAWCVKNNSRSVWQSPCLGNKCIGVAALAYHDDFRPGEMKVERIQQR